ncbi:hypothetical protein [Sinanaerobacter chloroacetimidivorans]|uniref:Uncharacterized protein n=1 Tax=Sinanaerobacter chloroacetimidivorans TaxID=2818044 RepID=A0A8J8B2S7_9FIRM|nr:hypothetical protein [Sinanaerobacter chloroacetimidivorans]MBR0599032.1 hypothetical protein [Sinanaerobacter chloroacetimidivorans]
MIVKNAKSGERETESDSQILRNIASVLHRQYPSLRMAFLIYRMKKWINMKNLLGCMKQDKVNNFFWLHNRYKLHLYYTSYSSNVNIKFKNTHYGNQYEKQKGEIGKEVDERLIKALMHKETSSGSCLVIYRKMSILE